MRFFPVHDFSDRAIMVTGSTRGIGRAIAEALFRAGATVGIHGRDPERAREAAARISPDGRRVFAAAGDFADPRNAANVVREFVRSVGRLDGLVNNAGGGKALAFRGMTLERWRATFAVNLEAAVCASREAYEVMRAQGRGGIVNMASLAAHGPGKWMGADYAAGKAGLVSLTKSLAFEAARFGVRVNAVSPGFVETEMTAVLREEQRRSLNIPLGRLGTPAEVARAVLFLLSDESSYVTGEVLHVDGGLWM